MLHLIIGHFCSGILNYLHLSEKPDEVLCLRFMIALHELKAFPLMLQIIAFWLSGKVVPYMWIIVLLKCIYVIEGVQFPFFLSTLAYSILNLADKCYSRIHSMQ